MVTLMLSSTFCECQLNNRVNNSWIHTLVVIVLFTPILQLQLVSKLVTTTGVNFCSNSQTLHWVYNIINICSIFSFITALFVFADLFVDRPSITAKVNRMFARARHRPMGFRKEWKCPHLIFNLHALLHDRWWLLQGTVAILLHWLFDTMPLSLHICLSQSLMYPVGSHCQATPEKVRWPTTSPRSLVGQQGPWTLPSQRIPQHPPLSLRRM